MNNTWMDLSEPLEHSILYAGTYLENLRSSLIECPFRIGYSSLPHLGLVMTGSQAAPGAYSHAYKFGNFDEVKFANLPEEKNAPC